MGFLVDYCQKRMCYIGTSNLHPLFECTADTPEEAMMKIMALVAGIDEDNESTDVDPMMEFEDTREMTNTSWPPFRKLLP